MTNLKTRLARAIGEGLDIADPLVGNVIEECDLLAAADAVLAELRLPDEDMIEAGAHAPMPEDYWAATILRQSEIAAQVHWTAMIDKAREG